jgi:chemotaxis signal transduction protein
MNGGRKVAGLLVRINGALYLVPAAVALRVAPAPRVAPVPGAPPELMGVAMHEGSIVPVVATGSARTEMIVCQHATELIGLVGAEIVGTVSFDTSAERPEILEHQGESVEPLDVAAIYARVQSGARPGRWGS